MGSSSSFDWPTVAGVALVCVIGGFIFYPNELVNPIRVPVTQASGEMRALATAVFDYQALVRSASPELVNSKGMVDPLGEGDFRFGRANEIWPELFEFVGNEDLDSWPEDPFDPEGGTYRAAILGATFILISLAEDGVLNTMPQVIEKALRSGTAARDARILWAYSPTNGSGSSGDILRVSY